ncbi:MAG: hypothetical protein ACRC62_27065 [Microcoleus sp.]
MTIEIVSDRSSKCKYDRERGRSHNYQLSTINYQLSTNYKISFRFCNHKVSVK